MLVSYIKIREFIFAKQINFFGHFMGGPCFHILGGMQKLLLQKESR